MSEQVVMMQEQTKGLVAAAAVQQNNSVVPPQGGGGRGGRGGYGGRGGHAGRGGRGPCFGCGGPHYVAECPPENKERLREWVRKTYPQHAEAEAELVANTAWVDNDDDHYDEYEWNSDDDIAC